MRPGPRILDAFGARADPVSRPATGWPPTGRAAPYTHAAERGPAPYGMKPHSQYARALWNCGFMSFRRAQSDWAAVLAVLA